MAFSTCHKVLGEEQLLLTDEFVESSDLVMDDLLPALPETDGTRSIAH